MLATLISLALGICPHGWWVNGVRPTGAYECRRSPVRDSACRTECADGTPQDALYGQVRCRNGQVAVVIDYRRVACRTMGRPRKRGPLNCVVDRYRLAQRESRTAPAVAPRALLDACPTAPRHGAGGLAPRLPHVPHRDFPSMTRGADALPHAPPNVGAKALAPRTRR